MYILDIRIRGRMSEFYMMEAMHIISVRYWPIDFKLLLFNLFLFDDIFQDNASTTLTRLTKHGGELYVSD